jgi:NAD+ synthase (glutamine-hydrolysing)
MGCGCSSADVNPIGSFSKIDLRGFLEWAADEKTLGYTALLDVVHAAPTAELEPITSNYTQTDEGTSAFAFAFALALSINRS